MSRKIFNIIIVEPSWIIYEGLSGILNTNGTSYNIRQADNLQEIAWLNSRIKTDCIIVNPLLIQNQLKEFQSIRREIDGAKWIGLVYTFVDSSIMALLDDHININDKPDKILASIKKLMADSDYNQQQQQENLSDREIDVLKLLVAGNANKEIADKLNISTHTVISHRKNISLKTGIKSVSGLTIYAVVKNIITIDNYRE
jgi:DNA-binding NarL/FixJ family response regulator